MTVRRIFRRELYNSRLKCATNKSIYDFDGKLPYMYHIENIACQEIYPFKYSIIELIACGFCKELNPNIISSWRYDISI